MYCKWAKRDECVRNAIWEMKGDLGQRSIGISYTRYLKKCVTQIYRDLYGDAVLVPNRMGTNTAAGNQQKHLFTEFCYKSVNLFLE